MSAPATYCLALSVVIRAVVGDDLGAVPQADHQTAGRW